MNKGPFLLRRIGRLLFWRTPGLYRFFALARARGDWSTEDYDLWLGGFPRSANTFAVEAFRLANPSVSICGWHHIPPYIIRALLAGQPGIFLLRKPEDAVVSWAILWQGYLKESLDYYIDFHRALLPFQPRLFVATFEEVTSDFGQVIDRFNEQFGTSYSRFNHGKENVSECFSRIEREHALSENELSICRPSAKRAKLKPALLRQLRSSPGLQRRLRTAEALYAAFSASAARAEDTDDKNATVSSLPLAGRES